MSWSVLLLKGLAGVRERHAEESREAHRVCAELAEALDSGDPARAKAAAAALTDFEYDHFGDCQVFWSELFDALKERGLYTENDDQEHVLGRRQ